MNPIPFKNCDIEDPRLLFGRRKLLQSLCGHAEGLRQIQVIGARRYGKTCLIKSFITLQKTNKERRAYPIYLDLSSDGIKGTANVYRYIAAKIISSLTTDNYILESSIEVDEYLITVYDNKKWRKVYAQLQGINDIDTIVVFDEIVATCSSKINQTILLIFDEYEFMAKKAFDTKEGPSHLRTLSNSSSNYITFWLIGAYPWGVFVEENNLDDIKASGVFNGVTITRYVHPLNLSDFEEMWKHECSFINDNEDRQQIENRCKDVYNSSGGVPHFAKEIGGFLYVEKQYPKYTILESHFQEFKRLLSQNEISILRDLQSASKNYQERTTSLTKLEEYGIIEKVNDKYSIKCGFLEDYIRASVHEARIISSIEEKSFTGIVNAIQDKIHAINDDWLNRYGVHLFDVSDNTFLYYRDMSQICDSREKFTNCINSIYLLYWEGAKENDVAGAKLPDCFKYSMFRKSMDRIRHVFGKAHEPAKLETRYGQVNKPTALMEITGSSIEPQTPEEWCHFQERLLNRLLQELIDIYNSISQTANLVFTPSNKKSKNYSVAKVVTGVFYKGRPGEKDTVIQDFNGYPQEVRSIRDGVSLSGGESVEYNLCHEPSPWNSQKKRWFAMDVHLKQE